ncbi:uncharacterized protein LTR77_000868 [Saxophila tyrrhenica]|uniref:Ribosomal protein/NADH dehydrogenase domain-containing protein n=1 Tax=Saxophila tyrrhenica TaxID=1690608 RepID=A0AAV9PNU3_9PEZI|nr:hypothetical protein LTR77_000868 [Saxophila tyrrhenica]
MVSLSQRMRKLQHKLIAIRLGPGALVLPKDVKRIHMRFGEKINGGHMGPRKFWRHELIRLKYHNPAVPMTVDRIREEAQTPESEAIMSVHFASADARQTSSSATSSPASTDSTTTATTPSDADPTERVETINMKNKTNSEILQQLTQLTKAYPIEPTEGDKEELRLLEEQRVRSERDSKMYAEHRARMKREREIFEQGRNDLAAQTA